MSRRKDRLDWMFRSRENGKITIGQAANLEQKIFSGATLVGVMLPASKLRTGVGVVAVLALVVWAVDEIARGVNPFRRILGGAALGGLAWLAVRRPRD
ncbi:hypothetical protein [Lacisediminihabitans sp. H27-G8]|uniref:hypothetical protein n=1 Tax=Lacisediminihabitans sp. H27-G8 TaxID=3111909 RepID=UPI0038FCA0B6